MRGLSICPGYQNLTSPQLELWRGFCFLLFFEQRINYTQAVSHSVGNSCGLKKVTSLLGPVARLGLGSSRLIFCES